MAHLRKDTKWRAARVAVDRIAAALRGLLVHNNPADNSHMPIPRREQKMWRFTSPVSAPRFLASRAAVYNTFYTTGHLTFRATLPIVRGKVASGANTAAAAA